MATDTLTASLAQLLREQLPRTLADAAARGRYVVADTPAAPRVVVSANQLLQRLSSMRDEELAVVGLRFALDRPGLSRDSTARALGACEAEVAAWERAALARLDQGNRTRP